MDEVMKVVSIDRRKNKEDKTCPKTKKKKDSQGIQKNTNFKNNSVCSKD